METFNTWNEIADLYEEKFMDFPLYNETYDFFCKELPENSRVLELGCGPGNIAKYIVEKRNDLILEGIDIAYNMINLAKKNNPSCTFSVGDIRKYESQHNKFSGIICGFCLPYLSILEIKTLIPKLNESLETNGLLYLSFVEGDPNHSGIKKGKDNRILYFYYHDLETISNLHFANNFKIEKIFQIDYKNNDNSLDNHIVVISKSIK
ncbi:class I SAM-dependent DNA methyltransferase [Leptospira stimsonii]|uniref:class I SAM-dependent DNA methyltransferase n=1 Tax=Leptospira stimsonii TaxID=2202203 RepID=UPI001314C9C9|nr:class I SAM-dependent methyltransferase [Leptospira stimsonii]